MDYDIGIRSEMLFESTFTREGCLEVKSYEKGDSNSESEKTILTISGGKARLKFSETLKNKSYAKESSPSNSRIYKFFAQRADSTKQWRMGHESEELSLGMGLLLFGTVGKFTGVIQDLLFQDNESNFFCSSKIHLLSNKFVGRSDCYHIWCRKRSIQFWIDKETLLIKKIQLDEGFYHEAKFLRNLSGTILHFMEPHLKIHSPEFLAHLKAGNEDPSRYTTCIFKNSRLEP